MDACLKSVLSMTASLTMNMIEGQAVLKSSHNIQIELEWLIQDTGHELQAII